MQVFWSDDFDRKLASSKPLSSQRETRESWTCWRRCSRTFVTCLGATLRIGHAQTGPLVRPQHGVAAVAPLRGRDSFTADLLVSWWLRHHLGSIHRRVIHGRRLQ